VAVVELAVIMPAFLLILLGVMDFGKVFNYWQTGTQAAAVGARAAAVDNWPASCRAGDPPVVVTTCTLQQWIRSQLKTRELYEDANVCVAFPDIASTGGTNTSPGHRVIVRVQVPYGIPLVNSLVHGATVRLRSSATMRIEVDSAPAGGTANILPADNIGTCT
jgi:Flp pilus assembly protein TadG